MAKQRILRGQLIKALLLDLVTKPATYAVSTAIIHEPIDSQYLTRTKEIFTRFYRAGLIERYSLRVRQALVELEKRRLITIRSYAHSSYTVKELLNARSLDYKIEVSLTESGWRLGYRHALDGLEITPASRWDGLWRIVALDIPESKKSLRDTVRQLLKRLGFKPMQRSLWVIPWPCKGELGVIRAAFGLKEMTWYIESKTIDRELELLQQFHLRRSG